MLIQTSGDDMGAYPAEVTHAVKPDQEYTWELQLTAPQKPGKYVAYFRMQTANNIRFGHKVWCDIVVVEEQAKEDVIIKEVPAEEIKEPQMPLEALKLSKTPKQIYFDQVAEMPKSNFSENLTALFEFGYVDFQ